MIYIVFEHEVGCGAIVPSQVTKGRPLLLNLSDSISNYYDWIIRSLKCIKYLITV